MFCSTATRVPGKILDVLVARDDDIGRYHNEMMELVQGWNRALEYIHAQPDKAMQIMAGHEHIDAAQFGRDHAGYRVAWDTAQRRIAAWGTACGWGQHGGRPAFLLERGLINMGADTTTLLDTSLLGKVNRESQKYPVNFAISRRT